MNPELLKTFLAVCKQMNFTRAAEERLLTQPAVSRQIKQLENRLGVSLFEKLGKSIQLTDAGRALVPQAAALLGQMDRIVETIRGFSGADRGRMRIGASTTPGYYVLPTVLGEFHRKYPEVELEYVVENTLHIEQCIVRNELDIAFVGGHLLNAALRIEKVLDDQIVCFCGPLHPLAGRRNVAPRALNDELWVTRERGSATQQLFEEHFAKAGGAMNRRIELTSPEGIKALVAAGIGVSVMSASGLRREFKERRVRPIAIKGMRLFRPLFAIRHTDKYESPMMSALLKAVHNAALEFQRHGSSNDATTK